MERHEHQFYSLRIYSFLKIHGINITIEEHCYSQHFLPRKFSILYENIIKLKHVNLFMYKMMLLMPRHKNKAPEILKITKKQGRNTARLS